VRKRLHARKALQTKGNRATASRKPLCHKDKCLT
jgi:hypothetical protein